MERVCRLLAWWAVLVARISAIEDSTEDPVGIYFLDCAGASVLAPLPNGQQELTIYSSLPEVRLRFPQAFIEDINENYDRDHYRFLRQNNYWLQESDVLYDKTIPRGDLRNFSLIFRVDQRCGGCFYQALVEDAGYRHGCPANISIDVPQGCVRTSFHVDWIRPSDVSNDGNVVLSDVTIEGKSPGDPFNPGVHSVTYYPNSGSDFEECSFYININANCSSGEVRTIIGNMTFLSTRVGSTSMSQSRFCPRGFGNRNFTVDNSQVPRAIAECIYDQFQGPIWEQPAELTDCLEGIAIADRFTLIMQELESLQTRQKNGERIPQDEVVEVGLAIDAFSRLDDEDEDITRQTAELLRGLIQLNVTSVEVTNIVLSVVNNFFSSEDDDDDDDNDDDEASGQDLNNILTSLEDQARNQINSGQNYTGVEENVALYNVILNNTSGGGVDTPVTLSFGNFKADVGQSDSQVLEDLDESDLRVTGSRIEVSANEIITSVSLPNRIQNFTVDGSLMVSFFLYRDGSLFQSSGRTVGTLGPSVRQVVGSQVVATIIYNLNESKPFPNNDQLVTTFTPITVTRENEQLLEDRICAFWDTSNRFWSTEGCTLNSTSSSRLVCQCTHATSFAILVNVEEQSLVFTWISQVGSTVSAFSLIVTICSILLVKDLISKTPWKVHVSLMSALLGLYLVFMFGADQTGSRRVCIAISALMHYFLLAAFLWMFFEGLLLYKLLVKHEGRNNTARFVLYSSLTAWGLPIFPVIAPLVLQYVTDLQFEDFYELQEFCFLKTDSLMMFVGLIGIMASILAFNLFIFIAIVYALTRKNRATQNKSHRWLTVTFVSIVFLFGLTWIIGFFAIRDATFYVSVVFSSLNAFQGFFLFLLFGVRRKEIIRLWASPCMAAKKKRSQSSRSRSTSGRNVTTSDGSSSLGRSNPIYDSAPE